MANHKKYRIKLTEEERSVFREIVKGKWGRQRPAAWKIQRAQVMLKCDESGDGPAWTDEELAESFDTTTRSIQNWRKKAAEEGPLSLLDRKPRSDQGRTKLDGEAEARLVQLACSKAPRGYARWSLRMLAGKLVELKVVDSISHESVRGVMKKTPSSRG